MLHRVKKPSGFITHRIKGMHESATVLSRLFWIVRLFEENQQSSSPPSCFILARHLNLSGLFATPPGLRSSAGSADPGGWRGSSGTHGVAAVSRRLNVTVPERKERRGFASMSPERQREIASKGGRAAHEKGTAHEWTPEEARRAGRKGGQVSRGGRGRLDETVVPSDFSPIVPTIASDVSQQ
jgi:general stress protein YciG